MVVAATSRHLSIDEVGLVDGRREEASGLAQAIYKVGVKFTEVLRPAGGQCVRCRYLMFTLQLC